MRVGNYTGQNVVTFPVPSTGNVKPVGKLTPAPAAGFMGLAYDASGDLWGSTATDTSRIVEFTPAQLQAGGSQVPHVKFALSVETTQLAFDGAGDLWITVYNKNELIEYTPTQLAKGGNTVLPARTIYNTASVPSLSNPSGLAFDALGDLWVSNSSGSVSGGTVVEFTPTELASSDMPRPKLFLQGPNSRFDGPRGIAFDSEGNLWVTNVFSDVIMKFSADELAAAGFWANLAPETTLTQSGTWGLAFDTKGNLWATSVTGEVAGWTPGQQAIGGMPIPSSPLIEGPTTTLTKPEPIAISAAPTVTAVTPSAGLADTTVTVHGTGFTSTTTVDFGAEPGTKVAVVSPFTLTVKAPPGGGTVTVTATTWAGTSPTSTADKFTYKLTGYDLAGSDGGVFVFPVGQASGFYGSLPGLHVVPASPVVGLVPTITDEGYFLVGQDGGVFAFGTAPYLGSLPGRNVKPAQPITGIVAANTDKGYFLVGRDGGVFAFGTVPFLGSLPGRGVSVNNIIGIASTPSGNGYWLVSATGAVYAFGAAQALGTAKGTPSPVSAIAGTPTGEGYWITTHDGAVYPFGNAKSFGTLPTLKVTPVLPVIGIVHTGDTKGYWLIGQDGGIFAFGDAGFVGSLPGLNVHVNNIVGAVPN